jgi:hypothetical protein
VAPDDYRCFLLDVEAPTGAYVTGFAVDPGVDAIVHHVIAYLATPDLVATYEALDAEDAMTGWTCFGGPGGDVAASWLGGWVPGSLGDDYPQGTGIPVPEGSKVVLQIHYNTAFSAAVPDETSVSFAVDTEIDHPAAMVRWTDADWLEDLLIPAGESDVVYAYDAPSPYDSDVKIYSVGLHQHLLGESSSLVVHRADGTDACLLDIPDWDFHWQGSYFLEEPVTVGAGDTIEVTCHWDNAAGTDDVTGGEGRADEMCIGILYGTLAE